MYEFKCPRCGDSKFQFRIEEDDGIGYFGRWIAWTFECGECGAKWVAEWHFEEPDNVYLEEGD